MSSDENSSDDELEYFNTHRQDFDRYGMPNPDKLNDFCDNYVQKIVNGENPNIDDYGTNFWNLLHEKLKIYSDNSNCMYWAAVCFDENDERRKICLEKAVKLGNLDAMFEYGRINYHANKEESIKTGAQAIKSGYRQKHKSKMGDILFNKDYYELTLEHYISQLEREMKMLKYTLQEEQLRPPEFGGSDYNQAKKHFESHQ